MIVILNRIKCHDWLCQADVTMIMLVLCFWTFLNALPIIKNSGKAYRNWYFKSCWNASVATLWGSGHHAINRDSWWQSLEANRSKNGFRKWLQICFKTVGQSFDSLLSWKFWEFPICCLIAQTGCIFCCKMYFPLYEITPNFFQDFD